MPLTLFSWLGWMAAVTFLAVSSYSVYCRLFTELAVPGWTSQLVAMSFFAALNALGISMLGEYVVRIYDQVRGRPLYLVDRTSNFRLETQTAQEPQAQAETVAKFDLETLDPLNLTDSWDDAYQHLLDQSNDLLELGDLVRAEAAEHRAQQTLSGETQNAFDDQGSDTEEFPGVLHFPGKR